METETYDVCVIGAGPGGYVAAIKAAQNGANVAIIEKANFGGTCLNIGCIPTKTLIGSAEALHKAQHAADFGVKISGKISADWEAMQERKDGVVSKLRNGIGALLKSAGVTVINGEASFQDKKCINVKLNEGSYKQVQAKNFIIATGSKPAMPGFIPDHERILSSTDLLAIDTIPKSLMVLGGGVIGCEFACLFNALGSKVTVVEMMPSILPTQDAEVSRTLTQYMKKAGIEVLTGKPLEKISATKKAVSGLVDGEKLSADYLLVSIGRSPVAEALNAKAAGITVNEKGWLPVDGKCRTNVPGIYAIGDITGTIWQLAHFASAMGLCAADNATGKPSEYDNDLVPGCIFTTPEIASVGLTTQQCKDQGIDVNIGKFPFAALGKAMAINETDGFVKIIADAETDQVLGVHIIGPHATDLISEAVAAMKLETTAQALGDAIHPHPTLGESMMEAAHAVHGVSVHMVNRKKRR